MNAFQELNFADMYGFFSQSEPYGETIQDLRRRINTEVGHNDDICIKDHLYKTE